MKQRILILEEHDDDGTTTLFDYTLKPGEILLMDLGDQGDAYDCNYVFTVDRTKNSAANADKTKVRTARGDPQKH